MYQSHESGAGVDDGAEGARGRATVVREAFGLKVRYYEALRLWLREGMLTGVFQ